MPCTDVVSYQFLIPLCVAWQVLFAVAIVHGVRHRDVRHSSRGWQLYASVVVILGVLAIESLLQLILAAAFHGDVTLVTNAFGYLRLLFCSLSDSMFIALLMAISGGYCITRDTLGQYKSKVIGIPAVYFTTDMILQSAMMGITAAVGDDPTAFDRALAPWQRFSLAMLVLGNLMALLLAWVYTFDFLARELEDLELQAGQTTRALQMAELGGQGVPQGYDPEAPPEQREAMEAGYAAAPVGLADAPAPGAYSAGRFTTYLLSMIEPTSSAAGAHEEEPSSFAEKLALRDKITLMQRFRWAVVAYIIATLGVQLMPVFLLSPVYELLGTIIILGHSVVLMAFLAGLGFIFRLRTNNPYLMLDEDGMDTEVHTGLGVLEDSPSASPQRPRSPETTTRDQQLDLFAPGTVPPKQPVRQVEVAGPKVDQAGTMPKQFSLADEDDYEELGLSRDNSAASPVMHVHPAFKSD